MARRRGSFQAPVLRTRRKTGWEEGVGGQAVLTRTASGAIFVGSALSVLFDGLTLVRVRGMIELTLQSVSAAGDGFAGAFGIAVTSLDAVTAGVASVPQPVADMDWDGWLWHQFIFLHATSATLSETNPNRINIPIDSKAMRKIGVNDAIYLMVELTEIGTAEIDIFADTRVLVKLA